MHDSHPRAETMYEIRSERFIMPGLNMATVVGFWSKENEEHGNVFIYIIILSCRFSCKDHVVYRTTTVKNGAVFNKHSEKISLKI